MRRIRGLVLLMLAAGCSTSPGVQDAGARAAARAVGLNDVSVLVPLPASEAELGRLLAPGDTGARGALLPLWARPGPALVQNEDRATTLQRLRVVATRLDPCFPSIAETDPARCQAILHVIWQPIVPAWERGATGYGAVDAAVHAFHRLNRSELVAWLARWQELTRGVAPRTPLQPHPTLVAEGLPGPLYEGWRRLVLRYAGADNLVEMTYLSLRANGFTQPSLGQGWLLSGALFEGARAFRVPVATTHDNEQHFGNNVNGPSIEDEAGFAGDVIPTTANSDALMAVARDSMAAATAPLSDIEAAVDRALELENPTRTTLASADCASCHIATTARVWAERHRGIDATANPRRYTNDAFDLSLSSDSVERTNSLHGLGWYGVHSSLSQRTVNDTAAAASFINARLLGEIATATQPAPNDAGVAPSQDPWTEGPALAMPVDAGAVAGLAAGGPEARLFVAAGSKLYRSGPNGAGPVTAWIDLAASGVSSVAAFVVAPSGDVVAASGSAAVRVSSAGAVAARGSFTVPFGGGFFGNAVAVAPDLARAYVVEAGPGSAGTGGATVVHVATIDLAAAFASTAAVVPVESWELAAPFHVGPASVGAINASAPYVTADGASLVLDHVVLRTVFTVATAAPHTVTAVSTDSLNRSATSMFATPEGLLVQGALFDQTVPVFRFTSPTAASVVAEIPVGLQPSAVAAAGSRVYVALGAGLAAPPGGGPGGGGFPPLGDGGLPALDGGLPTMDAGAAAPATIRVFTLAGMP